MDECLDRNNVSQGDGCLADNQGVVDPISLPQWSLILKFCFMMVIIILGIPGNGIILFVQSRIRRKSSTDYLVVAMAVCDLVLAGIIGPIVALQCFERVWKKMLSTVTCRVYFYIIYCMTFASAQLLAAMAFDRYRLTCRPLSKKFERKTVVRVIVWIAVNSLGICSLLFYIADVEQMTNSCSIHGARQIVSLVFDIMVSCVFLAMIIIVVVCYTSIGFNLRRRYRDKQKKSQLVVKRTRSGFRGTKDTAHKRNKVGPLILDSQNVGFEKGTNIQKMQAQEIRDIDSKVSYNKATSSCVIDGSKQSKSEHLHPTNIKPIQEPDSSILTQSNVENTAGKEGGLYGGKLTVQSVGMLAQQKPPSFGQLPNNQIKEREEILTPNAECVTEGDDHQNRNGDKTSTAEIGSGISPSYVDVHEESIQEDASPKSTEIPETQRPLTEENDLSRNTSQTTRDRVQRWDELMTNIEQRQTGSDIQMNEASASGDQLGLQGKPSREDAPCTSSGTPVKALHRDTIGDYDEKACSSKTVTFGPTLRKEAAQARRKNPQTGNRRCSVFEVLTTPDMTNPTPIEVLEADKLSAEYTKMNRTTKLMFLITATYILTWILTWTSGTLIFIDDDGKGVIGLGMSSLFGLSYMVNSIANPIIYIAMSTKFRQEVVKIFLRN